MIKVFLSILGSRHHKLLIAYGLTLVTPSLHGWEAFPTPRALTHTRITWALSPMASQVPGVTPGSPLVPMVFQALLMERCATHFERKELFLHWGLVNMRENNNPFTLGLQTFGISFILFYQFWDIVLDSNVHLKYKSQGRHNYFVIWYWTDTYILIVYGWCECKNKYQKKMRWEEVGLHAQNLLTILNAIVSIWSVGTYKDHEITQRIFTLTMNKIFMQPPKFTRKVA